MRADTFPADGEFAGSDPDLAFRQLIMEAGSDIAHPRARRLSRALPRGEPRDELRAERLAGQPLAGQPQQLARALAGFDLRRDRGAGGRRPRDRALGRAPLHGSDSDQGRAAPVMGRSEVRPDLGGGDQARHHRELPPVPRPPRGTAHPAGRIPQLQPRLHGHLLAAGREPGDEPDLRRGLRPLPDAANRVGGARVHAGSCR